jgi:YebC/PmpR family DNA-binding regulatory protein
MAGHSHSANIAHRKGVVDAKRGKLFSKLCRAIYVSARTGGGDPTMNLRLRYAIDKARSVSCPKENIERAIKKGTGEIGGENFEEIIYEGYGPAGVAVMCDILTDNRNRTAGELRKIFEVCGGSLGSTGCVSYLFSYKGLFLVPRISTTEERVMEVALEAGADDIATSDDYFEITCDPKVFEDVRKALEDARIVTDTAETRHLPSTTVELDPESARKMLRLRDLMDENDDVQNIYANDIIPESILNEDA